MMLAMPGLDASLVSAKRTSGLSTSRRTESRTFTVSVRAPELPPIDCARTPIRECLPVADHRQVTNHRGIGCSGALTQPNPENVRTGLPQPYGDILDGERTEPADAVADYAGRVDQRAAQAAAGSKPYTAFRAARPGDPDVTHSLEVEQPVCVAGQVKPEVANRSPAAVGVVEDRSIVRRIRGQDSRLPTALDGDVATDRLEVRSAGRLYVPGPMRTVSGVPPKSVLVSASLSAC